MHALGGRYRLDEVLGRGGTATVWRAWDMHLDRAVAVKVVDPGWRTDQVALARLRREARTLARLAHPNIVAVHDFDTDADVAYLVMDLVGGRSLAGLLADGPRLSVEQAVMIARQVCAALGAAHTAGVVHRDVKPANILLDRAGVVKVCDFGIARVHVGAGQATLTGTGMVIGTCQYMAPEQAAGDPVDARTDLYALGCVLYATLTGRPPFDADQPLAVLQQHLHQPPAPPSAQRGDIPHDLDRLIGDLLAKNPADRPASAAAVDARLATIAGAPTHPPTLAFRSHENATGVYRATPVATRLRQQVPGWLAALATGAVATTVLAAIVLLTSGPTPTQNEAVPTPPPTVPSSALTQADTLPPTAAATPTTPSTRPHTPMDQIVALAGTVTQQAALGHLDREAARELVKDLGEVARELNDGKPDQAADKFTEVREKIDELRQDGELTPTGHDALPDLNQIADSLYAAGRRRD